jgi:hypothetical protein
MLDCFAFTQLARLPRDVPENPRAFLLALLPASCELGSFVAFIPWLAALDEQTPQLFQTHHAADQLAWRVALLCNWQHLAQL